MTTKNKAYRKCAALFFLFAAAISGKAWSASAVVGSCAVYADPQQTLYALNHVCTQQGLNAIFAAAPAGNLPGWNKKSVGYARVANGPAAANQPLSNLIAKFWGGKVFFTNTNGGYLSNDLTSADIQAFFAAVFFDSFPLDNKPSIHIAYPEPLVSWIADYIREVQPHVFLGVMLDRSSNQLLANFTLDLTGAN